jgi:C-terminal processing protease CtpA/Prc
MPPTRLRPFLAAAFVAAALAGLAVARAAVAPSAREVQRLEDLARVWIYVDLFDPYLSANSAQWDQALLQAIPAVRAARDEAAFVAALNAMLRKSGDPAARVLTNDNASDRPLPPPLRQERGTWIADCNAMARAVATGAAPMQIAANIAAQPTIVDCRAFSEDGPALRSVIAAIARTRAATALPEGSALMRSYDGFPSDAGTSPKGFAAGFALVSKGTLPAGSGNRVETPLVFMLDTSASAAALPPIAALQSAGRVRVVAGGPIGSGLAVLRTPRIAVQISEGLYTYPAGAVGFRPDAIATPQNALAVAIGQLSATPSAMLREPSVPKLQRPPRRYTDTGVPPPEQRLLALFYLWGTLNYFHPYKSLMDRPWDSVLAEFVPIMLAAETRAAYEAALLRLVARTQDSHARIDGLTAPPAGFANGHPAIRARFVQGRLIVSEVVDKSLAKGIAAGDAILSIDNTPVAIAEQRLAHLIAASTPQALRAAVASRLLAGPTGSTASLLVRGTTGAPRTVRLMRTTASRITPAQQAWRALPGNVGYIDLEHLARNEAGRALAELMDTKAIVFDLRNGGGPGAAWVLGPYLAQANTPFRVARIRRPSYQGPPKPDAPEATWLALDDIQRPALQNRYPGRVFVLIDERTEGPAEHAALIFQAATEATFVGSPTNGTNGDTTAIQLPGGLTLRFSAHDVRRGDGSKLQRVGIQPHVAATPTVRGLRNGRDDMLEKALDLARR